MSGTEYKFHLGLYIAEGAAKYGSDAVMIEGAAQVQRAGRLECV